MLYINNLVFIWYAHAWTVSLTPHKTEKWHGTIFVIMRAPVIFHMTTSSATSDDQISIMMIRDFITSGAASGNTVGIMKILSFQWKM